MKRVLLTVGIGLLLVVVIAGAALAQGATPTTPQAGQGSALDETLGRGGLPGNLQKLPGVKGNWDVFDVIAKTLKLTPAQLFEQLHSGKSLPEIAKAQGVEMKAVQSAIKALQKEKAEEGIQKALEKGKITQAQADWMRKGLENGWRWPPLRLKARPGGR